jgi:hypothetical protein
MSSHLYLEMAASVSKSDEAEARVDLPDTDTGGAGDDLLNITGPASFAVAMSARFAAMQPSLMPSRPDALTPDAPSRKPKGEGEQSWELGMLSSITQVLSPGRKTEAHQQMKNPTPTVPVQLQVQQDPESATPLKDLFARTFTSSKKPDASAAPSAEKKRVFGFSW